MGLEISPFVSSLNFALEELAGITVVNGATELMKGDELLSDISVSIGLTGGPDDICLLLSGTSRTAQKLATLITGQQEINEESAILKDVLAEILNILVGAAQRKNDFDFDFTIPQLIDGSNSKVTSIFQSKFKSSVSFFQGGELSLYMISNAVA